MAQLGKSVKGKSKKGAKKGAKKDDKSSAEVALEGKLRRLRENDYLRRLAQASRDRLKQAASVEAANSKTNRLKIQNQWRKIMRLAKVESLRKDIEIISQNHERDVDRKDAIIQMLDRDLEDAEEQYQMALRSHLQNIDRLVDLQDSRLLSVESEFENDLHILADEFRAERDQIVRQQQLERNALVDIMNAVEQEEHERESESKQEHEQSREEIRNKNLEDINVLRITLESTIEELERHFESAHLNYLQNTDQRTQDFKWLTRKDQDLSKEIEIKIRKIERLQSSLALWRAKITQNANECEERNKALREEKDIISGHFHALKQRMNKFRSHQSRRLAELTQNARACKTTLANQHALASRILVLAEHARKLETEREKLLPFETSSQDLEEDEQAAGSEAKDAAEDTDKVYKEEEWKCLENFHKKYNKVLLDKVAIEQEKNRLQSQNEDLQRFLKQYLDGITVNDDVLRAENPLLVVNGKLRLNQQHVRPVLKKPTVVDGTIHARRYT